MKVRYIVDCYYKLPIVDFKLVREVDRPYKPSIGDITEIEQGESIRVYEVSDSLHDDCIKVKCNACFCMTEDMLELYQNFGWIKESC